MSAVAHLHDLVTGYAFQHPLCLPCGHTIDASTAVRIKECPLDRQPFDHRLLCTNFAVKEGVAAFSKYPVGPETNRKIKFIFNQFKLRFVQNGEVSAEFSAEEWKNTETIFDWMYQNLSDQFKAQLNSADVIQGDLEWNFEDSSYVFTLYSEDHELEVTKLFHTLISEECAQRFAGKYIGSLKSNHKNEPARHVSKSCAFLPSFHRLNFLSMFRLFGIVAFCLYQAIYWNFIHSAKSGHKYLQVIALSR